MTQREKEILNGVRGLLEQALAKLPPDEPNDEAHARGWLTVAREQVDKLLDGE